MQKYRGKKERSEPIEHWDRPERAKWAHCETVKSCMETREANAETEKDGEEREHKTLTFQGTHMPGRW